MMISHQKVEEYTSKLLELVKDEGIFFLTGVNKNIPKLISVVECAKKILDKEQVFLEQVNRIHEGEKGEPIMII